MHASRLDAMRVRHGVPFDDIDACADDDRQAVAALQRRLCAAAADGDAAQASDLLADRAMAVGEGGQILGRDAWCAAIAERRTGQGEAIARSALGNLQVMLTAPSTAMAIYTLERTVVLQGDGGATAKRRVWATCLWSRQAEGWRCVLQTESEGRMAPERPNQQPDQRLGERSMAPTT